MLHSKESLLIKAQSFDNTIRNDYILLLFINLWRYRHT
jgi:hypothetical protein